MRSFDAADSLSPATPVPYDSPQVDFAAVLLVIRY
jgi:hypothetical protein